MNEEEKPDKCVVHECNNKCYGKNYLIPDFYYEEVYENDDYVVYYAPYFD